MKEIRLKSADDIKRIREAGIIISKIFTAIKKISLEGVSTLELDFLIENIIHRSKARSSFKTVANYGHSTCISINNEVAHGIPNKKKIINRGDIVKIDVGVVKRGYFADACYTFTVKPISDIAQKLVSVTHESLKRCCDGIYAGNNIGAIGAIIQEYVEGNGFSIVKDFTGHGVGFAVHELPCVPHFGLKGKGPLLLEGMVLAVEPIVNEGRGEVVKLEDDWTVVTADGKLSAQFEHTIAVTEEGCIILTE